MDRFPALHQNTQPLAVCARPTRTRSLQRASVPAARDIAREPHSVTARARITLGIGLLVVVLAMIIREIHWLAALLMFLGLFLIVWGRLPNETEKAIAQLPGGEIILKGLDQVDMILVPRDSELERYLRETIERYDDKMRAALRVLLNTRNPQRVGAEWPTFKSDGLVTGDFSGPGPVKEEYRDSIKRILRDLGS